MASTAQSSKAAAAGELSEILTNTAFKVWPMRRLALAALVQDRLAPPNCNKEMFGVLESIALLVEPPVNKLDYNHWKDSRTTGKAYVTEYRHTFTVDIGGTIWQFQKYYMDCKRCHFSMLR